MASAIPHVSHHFSVRILEDSFGLKSGQIVYAQKATPRRGQLVVVIHKEVWQVARYIGRHIQLDNGALTRFYKLLGVVIHEP